MFTDVARQYELNTSTSAVECFDATAASVYSHACRLSAGNLQLSEELLGATYMHSIDGERADPGAIADLCALIMACHREFLRHPVHAPDPLKLSPRERAVLNLHYFTAESLEGLGQLLECSVDQAATELQRATESYATIEDRSWGPEPVATNFRRGEIWLDDQTRARQRSRIEQRFVQSTPTGGNERSLSTRARVGLLVVGVIVATLVAGTYVSQQRLPMAATATSIGAVAGAGATRFDLAGGAYLANIHAVQLDAIVRYGNNRIGVSWHGPCDQPASSIELLRQGTFVGMRVLAGSFSVLTCLGGMPTRWTAVVQPPGPIGEGPIWPMDETGNLATSFDGYYEENLIGDAVDTDAPVGVLSSALVDEANKPWVFSYPCGQELAIRYPSPVGPLFEATVAPTPLTSSCIRPDAPPRFLAGSNDRFFPHVPLQGGLVDCKGPRGSQTDLVSEPSAVRNFIDGNWRTWDSCVVRVNVIRSQVLNPATGCDGVRVITVARNIGEQFARTSNARTFIRDPLGLIGERAGLTTLDAPPFGAVDTGLRFGDHEQLWVSAEASTEIYLVSPRSVEVLQEAAEPTNC